MRLRRQVFFSALALAFWKRGYPRSPKPNSSQTCGDRRRERQEDLHTSSPACHSPQQMPTYGWRPARPGTESILALGIAQNLLTTGRSDVPAEQAARLTNFLAVYTLDNVAAATGLETARIAALAEYCANARPSLVLAGGAATATREATDSLVAANLLNYVAGNVGRTVRFGPSQRPERMSTYRDLLTLTDQMEGGEVDILFIHGVNLVFTFPDGERLAAAMANVPLVVSFASFGDETSRYADLVLPDHTPLEAWGDTTPRVGVHGL